MKIIIQASLPSLFIQQEMLIGIFANTQYREIMICELLRLATDQ